MHKVVVIENLSAIASQPKTKDLIQLLKKLLLSDVDKKALIVAHEINENLTRSTRNLPNVELLYSHNLNLKEILLAKRIVITQDALTNLTQK
jgi:large subunit ribosomal protein L4